MRYKRTGDDEITKLVVKDANIPFSNFAGKPTKFNKDGGKRDFTIKFSDDKLVEDLIKDGWHIRTKPGREGYDEGEQYFLDVKISYNDKAPHPRVELITHKGTTDIGEDEIGMLDWAEVERVDVVVVQYHYDFGGRQGVSAYLRSMKVWLVEDGLDSPEDEEPMPF